MPKTHEPLPDVDPKARTAFRVAAQYTMRSLEMMRRATGGELTTAIISLAITQANVAHLVAASGADGGYDSIDQIPPNSARRPISILALSANVGLPYETTRRQVAKMIAAGQCQRVKGGLIVPTEVLDSPIHRELLREHLLVLRRMVRTLQTAGVVET